MNDLLPLRRLALIPLLFATAGVYADEVSVRKAVQEWMGPGNRIEGIQKSGVLDLFEVRVDGEPVYVDGTGRYLFVGNLIDIKARRDLTQERKTALSRIDFSKLPLELAIKQVYGKGSRILATFEDPNCPYCRKLALELEKLGDVTIYTFLLPMLSPDSAEKARAVWCAKDRSQAWHDWMLAGKAPAAGKCEAPIDKLVALGRRYRISGTPTIVQSNGERISGYVNAEQLAQTFSQKANSDRK